MSVYIFISLPLLFAALFSYKKKISSDSLLFLFIPLFLVSAMRYDIGRDYDSYMIIFNHPEMMQVHEKGYMLINNFAIQQDLTLQFVIIVYAFLTLIFAYLFIFENSKNKILSLFIFYTYTPFYLQTLNTLRQGLAIYIFMYATRYIRERKFLKYCLFILFAAFFAHNSVAVTIPLYFLLNRNYKTPLKLIIFLSSFVMSGLLEIIVKSTPYAVYRLGSSGINNITPIFLLDIFLCIMILLFSKNNTDNIFYNITFLSLCILVIGIALKFSPLFTVVSRINEYFLPGVLIMIPLFVQNMKKYRQICFYASIICFFGVFYFSITINGVRNQLVPYKNFFNVYRVNSYSDIALIFFTTCIFIEVIELNSTYLKRKII